jgi:D-alanyl-lipoteichoic acid acyltransferase DltB (MBOAT superfamily)
MQRCIINNYTVSGFWKSWHSSLNLWIVKYIYIPMGGSKRKWLSVWFIFGFIALWHDLMWRWMAWALLNCLLFIGEIVVTEYVSRIAFIQHIKQISNHRFKPYYNILTAGASTVIMVGLILTNLAIMFGFRDSYKFVDRVYNNADGPFLVFASFVIMFVIAEIAMWVRERERVATINKTVLLL